MSKYARYTITFLTLLGLVEPIEYCHQGMLLSGEHLRGESVTIKMWFTDYTQHNPKCFYWCTADGKLPTLPEVPKYVNEDTLTQLVMAPFSNLCVVYI